MNKPDNGIGVGRDGGFVVVHVVRGGKVSGAMITPQQARLIGFHLIEVANKLDAENGITHAREEPASTHTAA